MPGKCRSPGARRLLEQKQIQSARFSKGMRETSRPNLMQHVMDLKIWLIVTSRLMWPAYAPVSSVRLKSWHLGPVAIVYKSIVTLPAQTKGVRKRTTTPEAEQRQASNQ